MPLRFRQDIQGLRALAVLLVALDHAHIGPFHGGFVGVDVFFVISGYLITSLLVGEAEKSQRISLIGFYARRARRILPAASLVMVATIAAALWFLPSIEARAAIKDAVWTTFFAANFKFASDGTDYFNADAAPSPLQHYWSLAVEEQFYIVWPLLLLLLCVGVRRWSTRRASGRPVENFPVRSAGVPILVVTIMVSFAWSVLYTQLNTVEAYFSPFTRAWELAVGALAACLSPWIARAPRQLLAAASWIGLSAVTVAALAYDSGTLFPGYAAALPVVGAALLLVGGLAPAGWGPQAALSAYPVRTIGDWSYSLYLWHWPMLVIAGSIWGQPAGWYGAAVLVVAVAASGLTYHLVENPFRRAKVISVRQVRGVLLYPAVVVVTLPLLVAANRVVEYEATQGGPAITVTSYGQQSGDERPTFSANPVVALVQASVLAAENDQQIPADLKPALLDLHSDVPDVGKCEYFSINENRPLCPRGDPSGDKSLVLIGDSHARQWIPALDILSKRYGYTAYYLVREGCPAADVTPWLINGTGPSVSCQSFQDWAAEQVATIHPQIVVMASQANPSGFADADGNRVDDQAGMADLFETGMKRQIDRIAPHAGRVVVIGDPPALEFNPGSCLSERDASLRNCLSDGEPSSLVFTDSLRRAAAARHAQFVETSEWFCVDLECPSVIGTYIARRDPTHVSVSYAKYLADEVEGQLHLGGGTA